MTSIKFPAGTYYVGDLAYVTTHDKWTQYITRKDVPEALRKYKGDTFRDNNNTPVAMFTTAYGDGVYEDDCGYDYAVDSGTIGCIPVDAVEGDTSYGQVVEFTEPFTCAKRKNGFIRIGPLFIDTAVV